MSDKYRVHSRGRFVEDGLFSYKVLSVHKRAINLLDERNELVVSLLVDSEDMTALSLLIPELFSQNDFRDLTKGDLLKQKDFDFAESEIWTGIPDRKNIAGADQLNQLDIIKRTVDPGSSLLSVLTGAEQDIYQHKAEEILKRGFENMAMLVGLGRGMTPAGDDFITGALLAEEIKNCRDLLNRDKIRNRLKKTTPAGRTLLHLALKGSFPAYLLNYIAATAKSNNENNIMKAVKLASQHGSTSGLDSLAGYYWYFDNVRPI